MSKMMNQIELDFWNFLIPLKKKSTPDKPLGEEKIKESGQQAFMVFSCTSLGFIIGILFSIFLQIY